MGAIKDFPHPLSVHTCQNQTRVPVNLFRGSDNSDVSR